MQFQVPQFIDVEDKIFGPLTLKQFLYLCGAGVVSAISFLKFALPLWIGFTVVVLGIACALAFVHINGQPMSKMLMASFSYMWFPKFYLWHYISPAKALPVIHQLPRANDPGGSPLKKLMLKFTTARGAVTR